jgi:hypothetical protein
MRSSNALLLYQIRVCRLIAHAHASSFIAGAKHKSQEKIYGVTKQVSCPRRQDLKGKARAYDQDNESEHERHKRCLLSFSQDGQSKTQHSGACEDESGKNVRLCGKPCTTLPLKRLAAFSAECEARIDGIHVAPLAQATVEPGSAVPTSRRPAVVHLAAMSAPAH